MRQAMCVELWDLCPHLDFAAVMNLLERNGGTDLEVLAARRDRSTRFPAPARTPESGEQISQVDVVVAGRTGIEIAMPTRWR